MKKLITIRLDESLIAEIDGLAKAQGIDRTKLIEKAIAVYTDLPAVYTKPPVAPVVYTDAVASQNPGRGKVSLPVVKSDAKSAWGQSDKLVSRR